MSNKFYWVVDTLCINRIFEWSDLRRLATIVDIFQFWLFLTMCSMPNLRQIYSLLNFSECRKNSFFFFPLTIYYQLKAIMGIVLGQYLFSSLKLNIGNKFRNTFACCSDMAQIHFGVEFLLIYCTIESQGQTNNTFLKLQSSLMSFGFSIWVSYVSSFLKIGYFIFEFLIIYTSFFLRSVLQSVEVKGLYTDSYICQDILNYVGWPIQVYFEFMQPINILIYLQQFDLTLSQLINKSKTSQTDYKIIQIIVIY